MRERESVNVEDSEKPDSAKILHIQKKKKKTQEKNSSTGRDCILDRTFDHVFFPFFVFWGVLFFLAQQNVFFEISKSYEIK